MTFFAGARWILLMLSLCGVPAIAQLAPSPAPEVPAAGTLSHTLSTPVAPAAATPPTRGAVEEVIRSELPPAPDGFVWTLFRNCAFLKPGGWMEQTSSATIQKIPVGTFAASPQNFDAQHPFDLGITVQVVSYPQNAHGIDAYKWARQYLKPFIDAHKKPGEIMILDEKRVGETQTSFLRYKQDAPNGGGVEVQKIVMANNATDSVHVFTFESPLANWDDNWKSFGAPILAKIIVIPSLPTTP